MNTEQAILRLRKIELLDAQVRLAAAHRDLEAATELVVAAKTVLIRSQQKIALAEAHLQAQSRGKALHFSSAAQAVAMARAGAAEKERALGKVAEQARTAARKMENVQAELEAALGRRALADSALRRRQRKRSADLERRNEILLGDRIRKARSRRRSNKTVSSLRPIGDR